MLKFTIDVDSPDFKSPKDKAIEAALETIGLVAETYAKLNLERDPRRIDTGDLRKSITHTYDADTAYVGTPMEYAPYVEFGTVKMKENPFIRDAVREHIKEYRDIAKKALENA